MPEQLESANRDRGIALFISIWLILVISVLTIGVVREGRTTAQLAANEIDAARAEASANAALSWTTLLMSAQVRGLEIPARPDERPPLGSTRALDGTRAIITDGRAYAWRHGSVLVDVSVQAEYGKYDLLDGDPAMLAPLLRAAGATNAERIAEQITARVRRADKIRAVSWRLGAKPINELAELAALVPMDRLAPLVTLHGHRAAPDPLTAPQAVFDVLPMNRDVRQDLKQRRKQQNELLALDNAESFTIDATVRMPSGAVVRKTRLVTIEPSGNVIRLRSSQHR